MHIVGFASDAFDLDLIAKEINKRIQEDKDEDDNQIQSTPTGNTISELGKSDNSTSQPPLAKHFLVFIFTSLEVRNCPKFSMVAARWATYLLDANFIIDKLMHVICALSSMKFIVIILIADGASENRSTEKQLAT